MKNVTRLWILIFTCFLAGCDLDGPMEECDYGARLQFHYSREGSKNRIRDYVTTITDYLYDDQGRLMDATTRTGVHIPQRTFSLPPGRYTLISWGNLTEKTYVHPSMEPGTPFEDMLLVKNHPHLSTRSIFGQYDASTMPWQQNANRLHYGRADFTIGEFGVTEQTVFVGHAYLDLTVTVVGLEGKRGDEFDFRLDGTHPVYSMGHYRKINAQGYPMYIPEPDQTQENVHLVSDVRMNSDGALESTFISYRLTNRSLPVFSVWQGEKQVVRNVDLKHFFDTMLIDMDTNECQEFHIRITVDGDNIYIQFVNLGDWIDGGSIG